MPNKKLPEGERRDAIVYARLKPHVKERLERMKRRSGRSISTIIEDALENVMQDSRTRWWREYMQGGVQ